MLRVLLYRCNYNQVLQNHLLSKVSESLLVKKEYVIIITYVESKSIANTVCCCAAVRI